MDGDEAGTFRVVLVENLCSVIKSHRNNSAMGLDIRVDLIV